MIRFLNIFQNVLIIGGMLMVSYGHQNNIPLLLNLGIYALAVGLILLGLVVLFTQRYEHRDRHSRVTRVISGGTVLAFGMMGLLAGLLVAGGGYFLITGRQNELVTFLNDRPGVIVLGIGIVAILYGVGGLLGNRNARDSVGRFVMSLPGRIFGVLLLLIGIGLTLTGVWAINEPASFHALWSNIAGNIIPPIP